MSAPTVTIKILDTNVPTESETSDRAPASARHDLYMVYVESVRPSTDANAYRRNQYLILPPKPETAQNKVRVLHRYQSFKGNRSKWIHLTKDPERIYYYLTGLYGSTDDAWEDSHPIVVPLERDSYEDFWNGNTNHKALRAVDRAIGRFGLSIK